jgi:hypothetical protein
MLASVQERCNGLHATDYHGISRKS